MADYRFTGASGHELSITDSDLRVEDDFEQATITLSSDPKDIQNLLNAILDATGASIGGINFGTGRVTRIDLEEDQP